MQYNPFVTSCVTRVDGTCAATRVLAVPFSVSSSRAEDPSVEFISAEDPSGHYRLLREPANITQVLRSAGLFPADAASRMLDSAGASPTEISSDREVSL